MPQYWPDDEPEEQDLGAWAQPIHWPTFWNDDGPDQDWLIEPIVPTGRQVAIYSRAKAGKSLLALDCAAAKATGGPTLGSPAAEPIHVVYCDLEMTEDDVRERLTDAGYNQDTDLSHLHYYSLPSLPPLDTDLGGQVLEAIAARWDAQLVVVDTMARAVAGEENDADTYRDFYRHTGRRLKAAKRALWRLDHAGKDPTAGQRGSSAKADDVDVVYQMTVDGPQVTLRRTHSRIPWVPDQTLIQRQEEPLRHVLSPTGWPEGTAAVSLLLDEYQVPLDATVKMARQTLIHHGVGKRQALIAAALKWRNRVTSVSGNARSETFVTEAVTFPGNAGNVHKHAGHRPVTGPVTPGNGKRVYVGNEGGLEDPPLPNTPPGTDREAFHNHQYELEEPF